MFSSRRYFPSVKAKLLMASPHVILPSGLPLLAVDEPAAAVALAGALVDGLVDISDSVAAVPVGA